MPCSEKQPNRLGCAVRRGALVASLLLGISFGARDDVHAGTLIDSFDATQAMSLTGGEIPSQVSGGIATGGTSIGGARYAALSTASSPAGNHSLSINDNNNGLLILSSDPRDQATVVLNYTGDTSGNLSYPGLAANFNLEPTISIVARSDQASMGRLFVYFNSSNWSEYHFLYPGNGLGAFETITVDLTAPYFNNGFGAILTNVAGVSVSIENILTPGATVQIGEIYAGAVPEPSTALLACLGCACCCSGGANAPPTVRTLDAGCNSVCGADCRP